MTEVTELTITRKEADGETLVLDHIDEMNEHWEYGYRNGKWNSLEWFIDWATGKINAVDQESFDSAPLCYAYKCVIAAAKNRLVEIELGIDEA